MTLLDDDDSNLDKPFGDWEPEDSAVAEVGEMDYLQVARRIHENRVALDALAGKHTPDWIDLTSEEQGFGIDFAKDLVEWLKMERGI